MRKRDFIVSGNRPAFGKDVNKFVKRLDLGLEGAFVKFTHQVTAELGDNTTDEQLGRQIPAIKAAYESLGCEDVVVYGGDVYEEDDG